MIYLAIHNNVTKRCEDSHLLKVTTQKSICLQLSNFCNHREYLFKSNNKIKGDDTNYFGYLLKALATDNR